MKKQTLHFKTLSELTRFSKMIQGGYLLNTKNFTLTGAIPELQVSVAMELFGATLIETTDKVYSYDLIRS